MTPLARRVMEKTAQKDHGTYERWIGAIVDATLDEAAAVCKARMGRLLSNVEHQSVVTLIEQTACKGCEEAILGMKEPAA